MHETAPPRARFARGGAPDTTIAPWLSPKRLELIILPTEKCNFRCTYCYETFAIGRMKPAVQEAVCRLIERRSDLDRLEISWFGGEPLLGLPVIRKIGSFAHDFAERHGIAFHGAMTTNGYLLGPDTARWLIDHGVRRFQISLDGDREAHDRTRRRADGCGTFDRIVGNLTTMAESAQRFDAMLRIHYHRENLSAVETLIEVLAERFDGDPRFSLFFARVSALGGAGDAVFPFLTDAEARARAEREFTERVAGRLQVVNIGGAATPYVCYACQPNSLVIRADGRLAKCTVALVDERNTVGYLREDGTLDLDHVRHHAWFEPLFEGTDSDRACPVTRVLSRRREGKEKQ